MAIRNTKEKRVEVLLFFLLVALAYPTGRFGSHVRWVHINSPVGKFTNVDEYLSRKRLPTNVLKAYKNSNAFFVAYSPTDHWFASHSGPAAYVFNSTGRLVDWTLDTGSDQEFQRKWTPPQVQSSLEELNQVSFND